MTEAVFNNLAPLAQSDLLGVLADAFTTPVAAHALRETKPDDLRALVETAGFAGAEGLVAAIDELHARVSAASLDQIEAEHARAFWAQSDCPPYESAFVRRDKGAILGDIAGFYEAFGFRADQPGERRADHLVCELEFLAALLVMAERSKAEGEPERTTVTQTAIDSFVWEHLGDWLPTFCERLSATVPGGVLDAAATALGLLWDSLVLAHNWPAGDSAAFVADDGTPYECPMATEEQWTPVEFDPGATHS
ncbi:MAG: molecular chaperone TorD family protein [Deltaproteobacteria bacterium]|nr:molecular chaperone TorD family protein [Deltaproteobacteria bacterium]